MNTSTGIGHTVIVFGNTHPYLVYGFIAVVGIAEGPILAIILGTLLRLGYFAFIPVYLALMVGDLIGDTLWYSLGYFYGKAILLKIGGWFGVQERHIDIVQEKFTKQHEKILIISKISNGFGFSIATILTAGISKIPFARFISINALGQLVWSAMLLAIGYFFGALYASIPSTLGKGILVGGMVIVIGSTIAYFNHKKNEVK